MEQTMANQRLCSFLILGGVGVVWKGEKHKFQAFLISVQKSRLKPTCFMYWEHQIYESIIFDQIHKMPNFVKQPLLNNN